METELRLTTDALRTTFRNLRFRAQDEYHDSGHLVVLVEEVGNEGKEEVGCGKCEEAVLHPPAFKCCDCNILFHLSCLKLGPKLLSDHRQRFPKEGTWDLDNEQGFHREVDQCFPKEGTLELDNKQVFRQEVDQYFQTLLSHCDHGDELIFEENRRRNEVCHACDGPVIGPAYKCSVSDCTLFFHKSCAHLPAQIHHPLYPVDALRLRLSEVKYNPETQRESPNRCNVCGKKCVNCLYYRDIDGEFVLDVACALRCEGDDTHDCQQHTFVSILGNFQFTCQACCTQGEGVASICSTCRLLIHGTCRRFLRVIRISHHEHQLNLSFSLRRLKGSQNLSCDICRKKVIADYAAYKCQLCDFVAHLPCTEQFSPTDENGDSQEKPIALIMSVEELKEICLEEIHQHNLILTDEKLTEDKLCDGCIQSISVPPFYSCGECNFFLHTACAELPRKKRHPLHPHMLTFLSQAHTQDGTFLCQACANIRHGFSYKCDGCKYSFDLHCCSFPKSVKHPIHRDSLLLALRPEKDCSGCGKKGNFACVDCGFSLCYSCVTIPVEASHPYDKHVLTLTYTAEDESEDEYYCLICEEKRISNSWFYYCSKCDFPAHMECVIGKHPYIKVGNTFTDGAHKHPLTFVRKRGESNPPCDACGERFKGLALECSECKFNVHCRHEKDDCLWKIEKKEHHKF